MASDFSMPVFRRAPQEGKIFLAKGKFIYYLDARKELTIVRLFCIILLAFLTSVIFQTNAFARKDEKSIKERSFEEYRIKGYEAQQKGNYDEALSFYTKAASIGKDQEPVAVFNDMGVIYEQLGLTDRAKESYLAALHIDDHYLPACANLASLYKREGDIEKAAYYFKKRIEWGDPDDLWTQKAKEELSELSHQSPEVRKWLLQRESMELTDEVVRKERQDFTESLKKADRHYKEGEKLFKAKKYSRALAEYDEALQLTPENPKIMRARDKALIESTKEKVKESTDSALKMLELGDNVSARLEFQKVLTFIPNEPIQVSK